MLEKYLHHPKSFDLFSIEGNFSNFRNFFSDLEIGETFKKDTRDIVIRDQKYCNIFFVLFFLNLNKAYTFAEINSWMRCVAENYPEQGSARASIAPFSTCRLIVYVA